MHHFVRGGLSWGRGVGVVRLPEVGYLILVCLLHSQQLTALLPCKMVQGRATIGAIQRCPTPKDVLPLCQQLLRCLELH